VLPPAIDKSGNSKGVRRAAVAYNSDGCGDQGWGVNHHKFEQPADVCFGAHAGLKSDIAALPKSADIVAKVENRDDPKIPLKSIFRRSCGCKAPQCRYESPWSFLCESMWPLTSPRAKRINGL
jgi:hypothetical protein